MASKLAAALLATTFALAALSLVPVASAGCSVTQTCAVITGSSMCSTLTGACSGSWTVRHSGALPGNGELRVGILLVGACFFPGATVPCPTAYSAAWRCGQTPPTLVAKSTILLTGETVIDTATGARC